MKKSIPLGVSSALVILLLLLPLVLPEPAGIKKINGELEEMALPEGKAHYDIPYGRSGLKTQKLDIYEPLNRIGSSPFLVYVHGGSWLHGGKEMIRLTDRFLRELRMAGFTVISLDYTGTLYGGLRVPLRYCLEALSWIGAHGDEYGYDVENGGIYGVSAGAHLALLAAAEQDLAACPLRFILAECGPTDLEAMKEGDAFSSSPLFKLFSREDRAYYSPVNHAEDLPMAVMIVHGTADQTVALHQAELMRKALEEAGNPPRYLEIAGGDHGFFNCVEKWPYLEGEVMDFMTDVLELPRGDRS